MENFTNSAPTIQTHRNTGGFKYIPFFNRKQAAFFIFFIAIALYIPSIQNEYALDDGVIIHQNSYVLKGIRGIKNILSKDLYHSFYQRMNAEDQLQGGRYRPLPVISFALEQELIGTYRSGYYLRNTDANHNGVLDPEEVEYKNFAGKEEKNYEYNNYLDLNGDGKAQSNECFMCWDLNKNFQNDAQEDLNEDGVFNEIDCQVYGSSLRHFNNIWMYALACLAFYFLLSNYLFQNNPDFAFLTALIFTIHPIHSEVIANVRGRSDIFSLLFICLTLIQAFKFFEFRHYKSLILTCVFFFLALLSKEYAILLLLLVPVSYYIYKESSLNWTSNLLPLLFFLITFCLMAFLAINNLYFGLPQWILYLGISLLYSILNVVLFRSFFNSKRSGVIMIAVYSVVIFYLALRFNAVKMSPGVTDTELLNNPFLLASGSEAFATKIFTLLIDLKLLLLPHPLVSDYSYASIAYRKLGDWEFILSLLLHLVLLIGGFILTRKRHIIGFAILIYLSFLLVVSNLLFPTGTVLLESYLFHASIGFSIFMAWICLRITEKINLSDGNKRTLLNGLLILIVILSGVKCWERSMDWKNDVTLFLKDVKNQPNSVLVLGNAGARWIDLADTREITGISLPGENPNRYNDYNGTLVITDQEMKISGYSTKREAALRKGIAFLEHAVKLHPRYVNGFLNLGLAYFKLNDEMAAIRNWKYAEKLYPDNPYLNNYYEVFGNILSERGSKSSNSKNYKQSLDAYKKWTIIKPKDAEAWNHLAGVYYNLKDTAFALKYWEKAIAIDPNHIGAKKAVEALKVK